VQLPISDHITSNLVNPILHRFRDIAGFYTENRHIIPIPRNNNGGRLVQL